MFLPNKMIPYSESVISKFTIVLDELKKQNQNVKTLYKKHKKHFGGIQNYIEVLDCLFALGKIELDEYKGEIKLCSLK